MSTDESALGHCPHCGKPIHQARLLVEYEKDNGTVGIWAECTSCDAVVAPE